MSGTPLAEVSIDEALIRSLLREQHPDLAHLPLQFWESGWDNVLARLGDELLVRLPRRAVAMPLITHEQHWLPALPPLPIPIPLPIRTGEAGCGYPWPWSIVPFVPGEAADISAPLPAEAARLALFLKALHQPAPASGEVPINLHRGGALADKADSLMPRLARLKTATTAITPKILALWDAGLAAPPSTEAVWLHGDLHARNVIVDAGRIAAIIDWGDICTGDPATDLLSIWALFADRAARQTALSVYGASAELTARAKAWVVMMAAILLDTGLHDNERHAKMGADMFARLEAD
jgi:aminoglycoside phosphotransferase (APT) family kinase protein